MKTREKVFSVVIPKRLSAVFVTSSAKITSTTGGPMAGSKRSRQ